jgi:periplasmic copper chaperone A
MGEFQEDLHLGESVPLTGQAAERSFSLKRRGAAGISQSWSKPMRSFILIPLVLMSVLSVNAAAAGDYKLGSLDIRNPWSRATPKGARTAAGYAAITNNGTAPDRLVSASLIEATTGQVHEMSMENGVMKMREITGGLEIKPGETVELKPQGFHIMFMGLKKPLVKGQSVKGTMKFEKAGTVDVEFSVEAIGASSAQGTKNAPMQPMHMDGM